MASRLDWDKAKQRAPHPTLGMTGKATDRQKDYLRVLGVADRDIPDDKLGASGMISRLLRERKGGSPAR